MKITSKFIKQIYNDKVRLTKEFYFLGLINSTRKGTLSFIDDNQFIQELNNNKSVSAVFVKKELIDKILRDDIEYIISDDPRYDFYDILNKSGEFFYEKKPSEISNSATIHETAYVSVFNVKIGDQTVIGPNVTILPDVEIGNDCVISPGVVIGSEGFEYKKTTKGILSVRHDGKVMILNSVHVGANTCIDKGFSYRDTIIGDNTKIDNLVHIAHGVQVGKNNFIIACSMIAGSVSIEDNVWVGPNSSLVPQLSISNNSFISIGSVVTKDVKEKEHVTGNFAIPHKKFLKSFVRFKED
jgi:UDP-3-O-[3-hydroxymyristoyl] glucosamine N-acyltransferase